MPGRPTPPFHGLVFSAPVEQQLYDSAFADIGQFLPYQRLLGFDAQVLAAATESGLPCFFTPGPEAFSAPAMLAWAQEKAGGTALLHLRAGPVAQARLIHGLANAHLCCESPGVARLDAGRHPFASQRTLPSGFGFHFTLGDDAGLCRIGGGKLPATPWWPLSGTLLDRSAASFSPMAASDWSGIAISSAGEAEAADWETHGRTPHASFQLKRLMLAYNRTQAAPVAAPILLPWNLANPASAVPDLVHKFARHLAAGREHTLIVLPYNRLPRKTPFLARLRDELRTQPAPGGARLLPQVGGQVFLARVLDLDGLRTLRRLAPVAWLDAADPEHEWNRRQLASFAIPALDTAAFADDELLIQGQDEFGACQFRASVVSYRGLGGLLAATAALRHETPALAAPERPLSALLAPEHAV
jgi:hypothetical protein